MADEKTFGTFTCRGAGCGRKVLLKKNKNNVAYYYCNGQADAGMCGHHEKFSPWESRNMIERAALAKEAAKAPIKTQESKDDDAARSEQREQPKRVEQSADNGGAGKHDDGKPGAGRRVGLVKRAS